MTKRMGWPTSRQRPRDISQALRHVAARTGITEAARGRVSTSGGSGRLRPCLWPKTGRTPRLALAIVNHDRTEEPTLTGPGLVPIGVIP